MPGESKAKKDKTKRTEQGEHQTNLAEGELDIVDESIKSHERRKDEQSGKKE